MSEENRLQTGFDVNSVPAFQKSVVGGDGRITSEPVWQPPGIEGLPHAKVLDILIHRQSSLILSIHELINALGPTPASIDMLNSAIAGLNALVNMVD